jgi:hypothetical protein
MTLNPNRVIIHKIVRKDYSAITQICFIMGCGCHVIRLLTNKSSSFLLFPKIHKLKNTLKEDSELTSKLFPFNTVGIVLAGPSLQTDSERI